jgi:hypothetical protein
MSRQTQSPDSFITFMKVVAAVYIVLIILAYYFDTPRPTPTDPTTAALVKADTIIPDPPEMDWGRYFGISPDHKPYIVTCRLEPTP